MNNQEHIVAVVESARDGDTTLDLAQEVVNRGGRATVVVLVGSRTGQDIKRFAEAENLTFPDAREIYYHRLAGVYSARVGGLNTSAIVADGDYSSRSVFARAHQAGPTTIAMPQELANRLGWRGAVARSMVPVLIAPRKAA